jgi:hypothetical protein
VRTIDEWRHGVISPLAGEVARSGGGAAGVEETEP